MVDPSAIFDSLCDEFLDRLHACQARARPRSIHELRVAGRKLEALLLAARRQNPHACSLRRQMKQTLRQIKEVRRAASSVRDLDVQRRLLSELTKPRTDPPILPLGEPLQTEGYRLDRHLERQRGALAHALEKDMSGPASALLLGLQPLAKSMARLHPVPLLAMAREQEERSAEKLRRDQQRREGAGRPGLGGKILHAYRKRNKAARYLAELEVDSAAALKVAKEMKSRLDAVGRWHDLALLAKTAKKRLGASAALTISVQAARRQALESAVRCVSAQIPRQAEGTLAQDPSRMEQPGPSTVPVAASCAGKARASDWDLSLLPTRAEPTSEPHLPAEGRSESTPPREGRGCVAISAGSRAASPRKRSTPQRGSSNSVRPTRRTVR